MRIFTTSFLRLYGLLVISLIALSSCCRDDQQEIPENNNRQFSLNQVVSLNDTTSIDIEGLDLKMCIEQEVKGVHKYSIWIGDERTWFYSFKDDIYTSAPGYGKSSIMLQRGSYIVTVGGQDDWMMLRTITLSCCAQYMHPDIPISGIQLLHCKENSGVLTGEIKLGMDIPKFSSMNFTLIEKEDGAVLKRVSLER